MEPHNWQEIEDCLRKPFKPEEICFRLEGPAQKVGEKFSVRAIPYVAAHAVQARLDEAVGVQNWTYRWTPVSLLKGRVVTVKGTLSVCGCLKEEEGHALKGGAPGETVAAAGLRNCALLFGVGRYLLKQGALPAEVESADPNRWVLSQAEVERLRAAFSDSTEHEAVTGEGMALASAEVLAVDAEESEALAEPPGGPIVARTLEAASPVPAMVEASIASEEPPAAVAGERDAEAGAAAETTPEMAVADEVASAEAEEGEKAWPDAETEEEATAEGEEAEETEADEALTPLATEETMEEVEEVEPEAETFEEDGMEEDDTELDDEIAEEAEEPAPQAVVHPEKVAAIRWLSNKLEVPEPVGLEAMPPAQAEEHLARLMAAWGEKQREASDPKVSVPSSVPVPSKPAAAFPPAVQVNSELNQLWNEYVRLFNDLYGHDPDLALRTTLKLKTFGFMIQGLKNQLAARDALPQGASRP